MVVPDAAHSLVDTCCVSLLPLATTDWSYLLCSYGHDMPHKSDRGDQSACQWTHIHSAHILQKEADQQHPHLDRQPDLQQPDAVSTALWLNVCTCAAFNIGSNP